MRYLFVLAIGLGFWGDADGATGMAFLLRNPDGRTAAMGDVGAALWGGGLPAWGNPAGLVPLVGRRLALGQMLWFQGIKQEYLGMAWGTGVRAWGVGLMYCGVGGLEHREGPSEKPQGTFGVYDIALGLSGAGEVGPVVLGGTVRVLYEKIYLYETKGVGADIGFLWPMPVRGLVFGGTVSHLGYVRDVSLPREVRIGVSYSKGAFRGALEGYLLRGRDPQVRVGGEVRTGGLSLRAGYVVGPEERNIAAGVGLRMGRLQVNYAWVPYYYDLGDTHRVCVQFGG
ncbi:MAG TPA: hypothetical protein EYP17_10185 [Candidatus Latescibacteria bacterium]|nr:hypothetical protein [Candidatus Latescibacterota bacterium]